MAARANKTGKVREWFRAKARGLWEWFIEGAPGDIRSAAVGAAAAFLFTLAYNGIVRAFFSPPPPREIFVITNDEGFAQPMRALLDQLKEEKSASKLAFDPPSLEHLYVCEYAYLSAPSIREIVLTYVNKYSMCLSVSEVAPQNYIIRGNKRSGFLTERGGNWLCKCGD
jgi:hypothetical protein